MGLILESVEEVEGLFFCFGWFCGNGVESRNDVRLFEFRDLGLELFEMGDWEVEDAVETGGTRDVDVGGIFAQLDDSNGVFLGAGEVNVAHLCERVTVSVIDCAGGLFAAMDMGDGDEVGDCSDTGSKHLIAVAEEDQEVWFECLVSLRESFDAFGSCEVDAVGVVLILGHFDGSGDGVAVGFDLVNGGAESRAEVGGGDDELEFEFFCLDDFVEDGLEESVVAAGDGDDGDFSLHVRSSWLRMWSFVRADFVVRPMR